MRKNFKNLSLILVLIMLTALLAGCGTSANSDFAYIKGKGTMIIGITQYPPMNFMDKEGKLTGFDTEFAEAVCKKLGVKAEFVEINWESKEVELSSKNIDCIWNGMCITEARKKNMSISDPYMNNEQAIVVKTSREKEILANVDGLTLTAEAGSTGEGKVDGSIADDGTEKISAKEFFANCEYAPSDSMAKALMEVKSGTADMAIVDATLAFYNVGPGTDFEDLVANTDNNFGSQQFGIAFRKESDVTEKVNEAMKALLEDGTLAKIASNYGLEDALVK
ncbi:MAG: transporter substrate-binding domain-containing protein [Thermoclostridium sp.]|nr:transporter substrate-binding domain-containing protein [Thermoclostridium sp.]